MRHKKKVVAAKPKSAAKKGKVGEKLIKSLPENAQIPQSEAKTYLPPGGKIWQDRGSASWCARVPPFKPVARSWRKHGHESALYQVVAETWKQWCILEGKEPSECPVSGVFASAGSSGG